MADYASGFHPFWWFGTLSKHSSRSKNPGAKELNCLKQKQHLIDKSKRNIHFEIHLQ